MQQLQYCFFTTSSHFSYPRLKKVVHSILERVGCFGHGIKVDIVACAELVHALKFFLPKAYNRTGN
jgi:hypothetical protein